MPLGAFTDNKCLHLLKVQCTSTQPLCSKLQELSPCSTNLVHVVRPWPSDGTSGAGSVVYTKCWHRALIHGATCCMACLCPWDQWSMALGSAVINMMPLETMRNTAGGSQSVRRGLSELAPMDGPCWPQELHTTGRRPPVGHAMPPWHGTPCHGHGMASR